jgi:deoxyribonuclease-4
MSAKPASSSAGKKAKPPAKAKLASAPRRKMVATASIAPLELPEGVLLGAHTSTSGGVAQSIVRATACGFTAAQIFVKNNKQWFAPPLGETEADDFITARKKSGIYFFAHNSYLINLGSPDPQMFETSVKSMTAELERAEALGLPFIVMHPGSHGGSGEEAGIRRIVEGLDRIVQATPGCQCRMALEITAGQGKALGYKLEHLRDILQKIANEKRFGACLDTAHLYAAGYNIRTREGYEETVAQVEKLIGTKNVLGLHLNDSKVPLGKRVDRHEHLGGGEIGLDCFKWIMRDPRWASIPKVLETPKSEDMHEDIENLRKLAPYLRA